MSCEVSNKAPITSDKKRKAAVLELHKFQVSFDKASLLLRVELTSNTYCKKQWQLPFFFIEYSSFYTCFRKEDVSKGFYLTLFESTENLKAKGWLMPFNDERYDRTWGSINPEKNMFDHGVGEHEFFKHENHKDCLIRINIYYKFKLVVYCLL